MTPYRQTARRLRRRGVTLSEVLVSMLVMSLGVISIFTLFPISILRSIQATQLTNATLLRQNAEARMEFNPELIHGSYGWRANEDLRNLPDYAPDPVWCRPTNGINWRKANPNIIFYRVGVTGAGLTGNTPPAWNATAGANTTDGDITWEAIDISGSPNYLVDPVGAHEWFAIGNPGNIGGFLGSMRRFDGGAKNLLHADEIAGLPDSWVPVFSDVITSVDNTTDYRVVIGSGSNLTNLTPRSSSNPLGVEYRALLFDETGKYALCKTIYATDATGAYLYWNDPNATPAALPGFFRPTKVQLDSRESRYSWMLTVRKKADNMASVDVVVFFNRAFVNGKDEYLYTNVAYSVNGSGGAVPIATGDDAALKIYSPYYGYDNAPGTASIDDDIDDTVDNTTENGWDGTDDKRTLVVRWTSGTDPSPLIKKGGFVLEARLGQWYRIVDFEMNGATLDTSTGAKLLVDRDLVPLPTGTASQLVFFRGVVQVYPLGMRIAP